MAAAEARGFIFAAPLAIELGVGFVPVRKPGKLPFETHAFHYELEYGTDCKARRRFERTQLSSDAFHAV